MKHDVNTKVSMEFKQASMPVWTANVRKYEPHAQNVLSSLTGNSERLFLVKYNCTCLSLGTARSALGCVLS